MSQLPVNLEISPLKAIALSQDQLASLKAVQQLLNSLVPGQVVEAQLVVEEINNRTNAVLIIQDTRLVLGNDQLDAVRPDADNKLMLQVVAISGEQLQVEVIRDSAAQNAPLSRSPELVSDIQAVPERLIDTTKLIALIQQVNPDFNSSSETTQALMNYIQSGAPSSTQTPVVSSASAGTTDGAKPSVAGEASRSNTANTITATATNIDPKVSISQSHTEKNPSGANQQVASQSNQPAALNTLSSQLGKVLSEPNSPGIHGQQPITAKSDNSQSITSDRMVQTTSATPSDGAILSPKNAADNSPNSSVAGSDSGQKSMNPTASGAGSMPIEMEQQPNSAQRNTVPADATVSDEVDLLTSNKHKESAGETTSQNNVTTNRAIDSGTNIPVTNAPANTADAIKAYTQPKISVPIVIPQSESFPLLATTVSQESQRLSGATQNISRQLNTLFAQLARLNQWQGDNKRALRAESGQLLNKASRDVTVALKDLHRYVPDVKQLKTAAEVKKAIRQSGNFLEAKAAMNRTNSPTTQPSIHQDLKANIQRVISASLYHIAKLQSANSGAQTNAQSTQPASPQAGQSPLLTPSAQAQPDLVKLVKQKLHGMTSRSIPADLPNQLIRILTQILTQTSRAMNRLQSNQLSNLRPDTLAPQWFFELPVWQNIGTDLVQILMRKEAGNDREKPEKVWSLILQFDIPELGKIRAVLKWQNDSVDIRFLAEYPQTVELIHSEINYIYDSIRRSDISLEDINVAHAELKDIGIDFGATG